MSRVQDPILINHAASSGTSKSAPHEHETSAARKESALRWWGQTLWAMLAGRCPRCRTEPIFRGRFEMNDPCPQCGLLFQREEGYFLGAMYVSYPLASIFLIAFYYLCRVWLPVWNDYVIATVAFLVYVPLVPAVFRYSRIIWIYFERGGSTSDAAATVYEKMRLQPFSPPDRH